MIFQIYDLLAPLVAKASTDKVRRRQGGVKKLKYGKSFAQK